MSLKSHASTALLGLTLSLATALPTLAEALKIGVVPGAYADAVGVADDGNQFALAD